ncbi:uncharacterized protein LOC125501014 isoform X2 [Athalia rosae]|uniref:uncharacterized protein LOC125501014 isoform X2 n=1 Tax=Athalia rosae TaxID=37344 RepID=UPI002033B5DA|nr:uncharacterized protein LOC125501014 isoform X2 [Athalia rosae]
MVAPKAILRVRLAMRQVHSEPTQQRKNDHPNAEFTDTNSEEETVTRAEEDSRDRVRRESISDPRMSSGPFAVQSQFLHANGSTRKLNDCPCQKAQLTKEKNGGRSERFDVKPTSVISADAPSSLLRRITFETVATIDETIHFAH